MPQKGSYLADRQKVVVVGAGPVGALAALYAASRGDHVEVYELRGGVYILRQECLRHALFPVLCD